MAESVDVRRPGGSGVPGGPGVSGPPGVQSVGRVLDLLEVIAGAGGELRLSELVQLTNLPPATIHRLLATLTARGYVRQTSTRRYALGPRLIAVGDQAARMLSRWARPVLADLVEEIGETANLAMLEGDDVVYVAQVPSQHSMRMFTEVGRRVQPHCTGVGKALLSALPSSEVRAILARTGLPARTPQTLTSVEALEADLARVRERGFAIDSGEQELGVCCVAVAVPAEPATFALSVSGPEGRLTPTRVDQVAPSLGRAAHRLADLLRGDG